MLAPCQIWHSPLHSVSPFECWTIDQLSDRSFRCESTLQNTMLKPILNIDIYLFLHNYSPPTQNWSPKNWSFIGYNYLQNDMGIKSKGCSWKFRDFSSCWALKFFKFDQRELRKWKWKIQLEFWNHDQNQSVQSTECPAKN